MMSQANKMSGRKVLYNVLVVEDEQLMREGIRNALSKLDMFDVFTAENGNEALDCLEKVHIDGMFLDISMPDMSGIELMKIILQRDENPPLVIVVSGHDKFDYAREALKYGALDYILKPLDSQDVITLGKQLNGELDKKKEKEMETVQLQQIVMENRDQIKQKILYDILHQKDSNLEDETLQNLYGIDFVGPDFMATMIHVKKIDVLSDDEFQNILKLVDQTIQFFLIQNELHDGCLSVFIMEKGRYVLLFSGDLNSDVDALSRRYLDCLSMELKGFDGVKCFFGRGNWQHGKENIANSYYHANHTLAQSTMLRDDLVYDVRNYLENKDLLDLEEIRKSFKSALKYAQMEKASGELELYFERMEELNDSLTKEQMHFVLVRLLTSVSSWLHQNGQDSFELFSEMFYYPLNTFSIRSLPAIKKILLDLLEHLGVDHNNGYQEKNKKLAKMVKLYIEEHFTEENLSVNRISETLNYSSNYIGAVFKKSYDMSINDFINQTRVQLAQLLLEETDLKIYEIAKKVGFSDSQYFSKIFKKYEGELAPTEYRNKTKFDQ